MGITAVPAGNDARTRASTAACPGGARATRATARTTTRARARTATPAPLPTKAGLYNGSPGGGTRSGVQAFQDVVALLAPRLHRADDPLPAEDAEVVGDRLLAHAEEEGELHLGDPVGGALQPLEQPDLEVAEPHALLLGDGHLHGVEAPEDAVPLRLHEALHLQRPEVVAQRPVR